MNGNGLSNKQKVFVEEYLKCWNATEAARRAGYTERFLHTNASKLLQNTTIKARIEARTEELKMSTDEVLTRLADQARGDVSQFLNPHTLGLDVEKIHANGRLIKSITPTKDGHKIELYDAQAALVHIGKAQGMFTDKVEVTGKDGGPIQFKEATVELPEDD